MQTNSQSRRDCVESKAVSVHDNPNAKPDCRGLRAEAHPVDEAAHAEVMKSFTAGVVTECLKLNVRKEPSTDAEVLTTIDALSSVMVDIDASSDAFYKVHTEAGVEGFCMKKYIALKR